MAPKMGRMDIDYQVGLAATPGGRDGGRPGRPAALACLENRSQAEPGAAALPATRKPAIT